MALKSPKDLALAKAELTNKTTARVENNDIGVCPICHKAMSTAKVGDINSYVCVGCRVSLPTQDEPETLFSL